MTGQPISGDLVPAVGDFSCPVAYGGHTRAADGGVASCDIYVYKDGLADACRVGAIQRDGATWRVRPGMPDFALSRRTFASAENATQALIDWWRE